MSADTDRSGGAGDLDSVSFGEIALGKLDMCIEVRRPGLASAVTEGGGGTKPGEGGNSSVEVRAPTFFGVRPVELIGAVGTFALEAVGGSTSWANCAAVRDKGEDIEWTGGDKAGGEAAVSSTTLGA